MKSRLIATSVAICATFSLAATIEPSALSAPSSHTTTKLSSVSTFTTPKSIWKLTLTQGKPSIKMIKNPGSEAGTLELFGATLSDASGKPMGVLEGSILTVDILASPGKDVLRQRTLTFMLPGGEIVAQGDSYYPVSAEQMTVKRPTRIAITGGTGKYIGASGQVTTVHLADDTYQQVIELVRY